MLSARGNNNSIIPEFPIQISIWFISDDRDNSIYANGSEACDYYFSVGLYFKGSTYVPSSSKICHHFSI